MVSYGIVSLELLLIVVTTGAFAFALVLTFVARASAVTEFSDWKTGMLSPTILGYLWPSPPFVMGTLCCHTP